MVAKSHCFYTGRSGNLNEHTEKKYNMSKPIIENLRTWPRNLSTSLGGGLSTALNGGMSTALNGGASTALYGGLSTALYGGMSTALYGGLSTALYGGLSTALYGGLSTALYGGLSTALGGGLSTALGGGMSTASGNVYRSNIPPWPHFVRELQQRGYNREVELIKRHLPRNLWPENFF